MKAFYLSVSVLLMGLILNSCSQYDDGPGFSLYAKGNRIEGTWYFSRVSYNDIDSTEVYDPGSIQFFLGEGSGKDWGIFSWDKGYNSEYVDPNQRQGGPWEFIADKDSLQMVIVSLRVEDYDTIYWKINRLAYDEFWIERHIDDTTRVLWQLWKLVY